ncbi:amidohydrolase [Fusarium pseudoanthophilum]|uniref:Amidohydrolase n=1 Tax=Fusarium pseudoanthophilum TaxID=48495 RepID=A0A8H5KAL4_9HYPO|nr:amidohydrolase [Fusarium pseudoanthophilum]
MANVACHQYNKQNMTRAADVMAYSQAVASNTDGIQHKQFVTPTLNVFEFAYRSKTLQKYFSVTPGSNRTIQHAETIAKLLYQHGLPLIAGINSVGQLAVGDESALVPWDLSLHFEMQNLVRVLGMSPAEATNSATRDATKWHRMADRSSIQVEKSADLVLLNKDPLADIANTLSIDRIWAFGVPVALVAQTTNSSMTNPASTPVKVK